MVNDPEIEAAEAQLRAALARADKDARHPSLRLSYFVVEPLEEGDTLDDADELNDLAPSVSDQVRGNAHIRRGALIEAAMETIEQCLSDLEDLQFDEDGMPEPARAEESVVYCALPTRHRSSYTRRFFRDVLVVAVKVGYDLADPNGGPASCTAEEILRSYIGEQAMALCELAGVEAVSVDDVLLEDTDFEALFVDAHDGLESDPAHQAAIGLEVSPVSEWFTPFNEGRVVHPFVRTEPSPGLEMFDLRRRLAGLDHAEVDWSGADAPTPMSGFTSASTVVTLARAAAADGEESGGWVAAGRNAEDSFGDLVRVLTLSPSGSGWLTWEPHEGADVVRTAGVITATAHRHFPVGADEPYLDVSFGSWMIAVPLRAVVSYEPDPEPRRCWEEAMAVPPRPTEV